MKSKFENGTPLFSEDDFFKVRMEENLECHCYWFWPFPPIYEYEYNGYYKLFKEKGYEGKSIYSYHNTFAFDGNKTIYVTVNRIGHTKREKCHGDAGEGWEVTEIVPRSENYEISLPGPNLEFDYHDNYVTDVGIIDNVGKDSQTISFYVNNGVLNWSYSTELLSNPDCYNYRFNYIKLNDNEILIFQQDRDRYSKNQYCIHITFPPSNPPPVSFLRDYTDQKPIIKRFEMPSENFYKYDFAQYYFKKDSSGKIHFLELYKHYSGGYKTKFYLGTFNNETYEFQKKEIGNLDFNSFADFDIDNDGNIYVFYKSGEYIYPTGNDEVSIVKIETLPEFHTEVYFEYPENEFYPEEPFKYVPKPNSEIKIHIEIKDENDNLIDESYNGHVTLTLLPTPPFDAVYSHTLVTPQNPASVGLLKGLTREPPEPITLEIKEGDILNLNETFIKVYDHLSNAELEVAVVLIKGEDRFNLDNVKNQIYKDGETNPDGIPDLWEHYQITELRKRGFSNTFSAKKTITLTYKEGTKVIEEKIDIWDPAPLTREWDLDPIRNYWQKNANAEDAWLPKGEGLRAIDEWRGYSETENGPLKERLNCFEIEKFVKFGESVTVIYDDNETDIYNPRDIYCNSELNGNKGALDLIKERLKVKYIFIDDFTGEESKKEKAYPFLGEFPLDGNALIETNYRFAQRHILELRSFRDEDDEHKNYYLNENLPIALNRGYYYKFTFPFDINLDDKLSKEIIYKKAPNEYDEDIKEETPSYNESGKLVSGEGTQFGFNKGENNLHTSVIYIGSICNLYKITKKTEGNKTIIYNTMCTVLKDDVSVVSNPYIDEVRDVNYREIPTEYNLGEEGYLVFKAYDKTKRYWYNIAEWNIKKAPGNKEIKEYFLKQALLISRIALHELGHSYGLDHPNKDEYSNIILNNDPNNNPELFTPMAVTQSIFLGEFYKSGEISNENFSFNWAK